MRNLTFALLLLFAFPAWAGPKKQDHVKDNGRLTAEQVTEKFGVIFQGTGVFKFAEGSIPLWIFSCPNSEHPEDPTSTLIFSTFPNPTPSQVLIAMMSSKTTSDYYQGIIKALKEKAGSPGTVQPGI